MFADIEAGGFSCWVRVVRDGSRACKRPMAAGAGDSDGWAATGFGLDIRTGPVLLVGYEDAQGIVRARASAMRAVGELLKRDFAAAFKSGRVRHMEMQGHPIFGPAEGTGAALYNARPGPRRAWRHLWQHAADMDARMNRCSVQPSHGSRFRYKSSFPQPSRRSYYLSL